MGSWLFKNWKYEASLCWLGTETKVHLIKSQVKWVSLGGRPSRSEHHQEEVVNVAERDLGPHLNILIYFSNNCYINTIFGLLRWCGWEHWGKWWSEPAPPIFQNVSPNVIINAIVSLSKRMLSAKVVIVSIHWKTQYLGACGVGRAGRAVRKCLPN